MSYAVIKTGGKQYRVMAGEILRVELLTAEVDSTVQFDQVLLVGEGESITVGAPLVAGATAAWYCPSAGPLGAVVPGQAWARSPRRRR